MPTNTVGAVFGTGYGTEVTAVWLQSYVIPSWHGSPTGVSLQTTYSSGQSGTQTDIRFAVYVGGTENDPTGATLVEEWVENTARVDWDAPTFTLSGVYTAGTPVWVIVKGQTGSGRILHHYTDTPDWGPSNGWFTSSSTVSTDPAVAFPASWPTEGNPNGGSWGGSTQKWALVYSYTDLSPAITSTNATASYVLEGSALSLYGANFGGTQGAADKVFFIDTSSPSTATVFVEATSTSWSDTQVDVTVPTMQDYGSYYIYVVKDYGGANQVWGSSGVSVIVEVSAPSFDDFTDFEAGTLTPLWDNDAGNPSGEDWAAKTATGGGYGTGPTSGSGGSSYFAEFVTVNLTTSSMLVTQTAIDGSKYRTYLELDYCLHWYFSNGYASGTMAIEAWDGNAWATVYSKSTADTYVDAGQTPVWNTLTIDLTPYTNVDLTLRVIGTSNSDNYANTNPVAIDNVHVYRWARSSFVDGSSILVGAENLTPAAHITIDAAAAILSDNYLQAIGRTTVPVNASIALSGGEALSSTASRLLTPRATLYGDNTITASGTKTISGSFSGLSKERIYAIGRGGSPVPPNQKITFDVTDEVLVDVDPPASTPYVDYTVSSTFVLDGTGAACSIRSSVNGAEINTKTINSCDGLGFGLTQLLFELDQKYVLGDVTFELTQSYGYVDDMTVISPELDQEWSFRAVSLLLTQEYALDSGGTNLREFELGVEYNRCGMDFANEVLSYVNHHRDLFGLDPIVSVRSDLTYDIAAIHSRNMAEIELMAHDSQLFPVGWQTFSERFQYLEDYESATSGAENLATFVHVPSYTDANGNVIYKPPTAYQVFEGWKNSPPHNANMLMDWGEDGSPVMLFSMSATNRDSDPLYIYVYVAQVFIAYGIPGDTDLYNFELTQEWETTGALITYISQDYFLDARIRVYADNISSYSLMLSAQHVSSYEARVSAQHTAPIHYTVSADHIAPYTQSVFTASQHKALYDIAVNSVVADSAAVYSIRLAYGHTALYGDAPVVTAQHTASYSQKPVVQVQHSAVYANALQVSAYSSAVYSIRALHSVQHEAPYTEAFEIAAQHESNYAIELVNRPAKAHEAYWTIVGDTTIQGGAAPIVTVNGVNVEALEVSISMSDDDILWTCRMILSDMSGYILFDEGTEFTVDAYGDVYSFVYGTKSIDRSNPAQTTMVVEGQSKALLLTSPRATPVSKSYDIPTLASAIVEDILGQSVTWDFMDWYVPAHLIVTDNSLPLDFVSDMLSSFGAIITSDLDGSLIVRKKYIVDTNKYDQVTPSYTYTDTYDNLSSSYVYEPREGYNKYRITDRDTSYGDVLEFIPDEADQLSGILRAYPIPWRLSIAVKTTDQGSAFIGAQSWTTRDEEDLVEFVAGASSLSYIAESIDSIHWYSVSLGAVTHVQYTSELSCSTSINNGYGLALIKYKVKCLECTTQGVSGIPVQYVIEDQ